VVHAPGDGGVVVAEDGLARQLAYQVGAFVGRPAVADRVAQAVVHVDALGLVGLEHGAQGLEVGVDVAEYSEAHPFSDARLREAALQHTRLLCRARKGKRPTTWRGLLPQLAPAPAPASIRPRSLHRSRRQMSASSQTRRQNRRRAWPSSLLPAR